MSSWGELFIGYPNTVTIAQTFLIDFMVLYVISVFTLGLGLLAMPGYLHCWPTVSDLLTTDQYKKPTEPDVSEWRFTFFRAVPGDS